MSQTAIQEIRPWDRASWRPVRGKAGVLSYLVLIHVLAVIGLILFPLPSLRILSLTLLFTALGGLGTTVCYHRVLAHRTLKLPAGFLGHVQRLRSSGKLGRLPPEPSLTYRYA